MKKRLLSFCFFSALRVLASLYKYFFGASTDPFLFWKGLLSLSFVDTLEFSILETPIKPLEVQSINLSLKLSQ